MTRSELLDAVSRWNWWGGRSLATGVRRDDVEKAKPWLHRPQAVAVCGIRRCGKSTLMRQLARFLIDQGTPPESILAVNFEEPVFHEHRPDHRLLDEILALFRQVMNPRGVPHLFLDEVHNVHGWERWARVHLDADQIRLVVSGSSSSILEPDVATVLTGRCIVRTLWPLSFPEYLRFRGLELPADGVEALRTDLLDESVRYLRHGGMPECVLTTEIEVKETLLKQYFRDILYRDVVSRHDVRNVRGLEALAHNLLVNTGNLMTYNRLKNTLDLAMDQVRSYCSYLQECYLVQFVPRFTWKASGVDKAPRKVYATDTGLRNAVSFRFSGDIGRLAETAVAMHLARDPDSRLFYHSGRHECDFVVWKGDRAAAALQVCWTEEGAIPDRELQGLSEAMDVFGLKEGCLITRDSQGTRTVPSGTVHLVPLWLWLAGAQPSAKAVPMGL